jgi:hypothetical protein
VRTEKAQLSVHARLARNEKKKRKNIAALDIDYDFPGYSAAAALQSKMALSTEIPTTQPLQEPKSTNKKVPHSETEAAASQPTSSKKPKTPKSQRK